MSIVSDSLPKALQTPFLLRILKSYFSNDTKAYLDYLKKPLPTDFLEYLNKNIETSTQDLMFNHLRRQRNMIMAHIASRELLGLDDIRSSCFALSSFADACLWFVHNYHYSKLVERYGTPMSEIDETEQMLIILGMGKLGGQELNFSSDIDLIFAFNHNGKTNHPREHRRIQNSEFFIRLSQQIIAALDNVTHEGFVFRVDARLRPFGKAGPLACGFETLELYYLNNARPWERFALGKARAITGLKKDWEILMPMFESFVYRRHIDFSILEDLRETKAMIGNKLSQSASNQWNVKLGTGGIREIEFLLQSQQLIFAGRDKKLRCRGVFESLDQFALTKLLPIEIIKILSEDYRFLRKLEQRMQYWGDEQTHLLPDNDNAQYKWLVHAMGFEDIKAFHTTIQQVRTQVTDEFHSLIFRSTNKDAEAFDWIGIDNIDNMDALYNRISLTNAQFKPSKKWLEMAINFNASSTVMAAPLQGKQHMNALYPLIIQNTATQNPIVLGRIFNILSTTIKISNYMALLVENANVLALVINIVSKSGYLAEDLQKYPTLLDSMLVPAEVIIPPNRGEMQKLITRTLKNIAEEKIDEKLNAMREFKRLMVFRIAFANCNQVFPIDKTSNAFSCLAFVVVRNALNIAIEMLQQSQPVELPDFQGDLPLIVVGYGKVGSSEMGLASDLDIVVLYDKDDDKYHLQEDWFLRLARKLIQVLTASNTAGILYEIDTRLRPDGNSGALVVSLDQFKDYQRDRAQIWERQSLIKARPIAGGLKLSRKFNQFRKELLCSKIDDVLLKSEVLEMRKKMRENLDKTTEESFDIKHGHGGLVDAEFITQYLVLKNAWQYPQITNVRSVQQKLSKIAAALPEFEEAATEITENYLRLSQLGMDCALQNEPLMVTQERVGNANKIIKEHWDDIFANE